MWPSMVHCPDPGLNLNVQVERQRPPQKFFWLNKLEEMHVVITMSLPALAEYVVCAPCW